MRHPDEGTIHAWLDGALPPGEGAALEAHVAGCAACAAAVAEARGVLAAASRILSALDSVPGGVIPEAPMSSGARAAVRQRTVRRRFRELRVSTGAWRVAAAVLVLAGGSWLATMGTRREKPDSVQFAMYADTTTFRIPGVVVDAPPSVPSRSAESVSAPSRPTERYATSRLAGGSAGSASSAAAEASANVAPPMVASAPMTSAPTISAPTASAPPAVRQSLDSAAATGAARALESSAIAANELRLEAQRRSVMADRAQTPAPAAALRERAPRLVVDRAMVDSVLAADSVAVAARPLGSGGVGRAAGDLAKAAPAGAPAEPRMRAAMKRSDSEVTRASGCWVIDTGAWSPRARDDEDMALLPRRVELRAERGVLGDERGELVLRPAPGEESFPAGTAATWKPLGRDGIRMTIGDSTSWVVATVTLDGDALHGRVRAYEAAGGRIRSAELTGRRVVCRTER